MEGCGLELMGLQVCAGKPLLSNLRYCCWRLQAAGWRPAVTGCGQLAVSSLEPCRTVNPHRPLAIVQLQSVAELCSSQRLETATYIATLSPERLIVLESLMNISATCFDHTRLVREHLAK